MSTTPRRDPSAARVDSTLAVQSGSVERLGYRRSIDGLRAFAILGVMAAHAHATAVRGGTLGVDVFFVLSGFLITTIILEEVVERSAFRFGVFYVRRALRLLPALYAMLAVVLVYSLVQAGASDRATIPHSVLVSAAYAANLPYIGATSSFLAHTWSLALEEQFYVLWPPILVLAWRRRHFVGIEAVLVSIVVVCTAIRLIGITGPWVFLVGDRVDALFLGCLLAVMRTRRPHSFVRGGTSKTIGSVSFLVLLVAFGLQGHLYSASLLNRGGYVVVALATAGLITHLVAGNSWIVTIFGTRPAVAIGKISYALYLWHVPVYKWFFEHTALPGSLKIPTKIAVSFAMAGLSYVVVEQPIRQLKEKLTSRPVRTRALAE